MVELGGIGGGGIRIGNDEDMNELMTHCPFCGDYLQGLHGACICVRCGLHWEGIWDGTCLSFFNRDNFEYSPVPEGCLLILDKYVKEICNRS